MNRTYIMHVAIFVGVLILLNFFFHWHIAILASVLLTIGLNVLFQVFSRG